ncbi:MAG TPA: LPXTG cell wall anchor domain-containing protein [Candidatus Anaerobutyricum avicola]|nr:LPXTG cell wall anchor domain-containing protein [Candidatus Anaerobutyricum avicola]
MKQRFFTIRNHGVLLTVLLVLSLALGTFTDVHVYAEDGDVPAVAEAYDPDAPGSIRVELSDIAGQENVSKDGVELTLYKVGDIHTENHYIQFSLTEELREVESLSGFDLNAITTGEANKEAAGLLETAVREADITPAGVEYTETVTDEAGVSTDGVAVFDGEDGKGLAQGMYLLVQTNANAYGITSSALIAIPYMADGVHWMYDVTVQPKGVAFDSLGSIQVTKALKYDNDGILLDTTAENASYDIGLFMDSQGQYRYGGDNWRQTVTIQNGSSGTVSFDNLPITDKPYYVFELDENGQSIPYGVGSDTGTQDNLFTVMAGEDASAGNAGEAPEIILDGETNRSASAVISNVYAELPAGYYVTGDLTITKSVMNDGQMVASGDVFYAGIFPVDAQGNVGAAPVDVVKLNNNASVTVEVPLGGTDGTQPVTYAVRETNENGVPVSQDSTFLYEVTGEGNVDLSLGQTTGTVNITNTLSAADGYYQEEPSTQAPNDPGTGNDNSRSNANDNRSDNDGNGSQNGDTSSGTGRSSSSARTGDDNQIFLYAGLLAAAVIVGGVVVMRRRRRG